MVDKSVVWNNGQRRRLAKEESKPRGRKLAYNEAAPRSLKRIYANTFVKCEDCGDRLLRKNLPAHVHKALLHVKKGKKKLAKIGG